MQRELKWLNAALATKDIVQEMTHYRVKDRLVCATDGRITAGHPIDTDEAFLIPGNELERILKRMPDDYEIVVGDDDVTLKSGRLRGRIKVLPVEEWEYPGVEGVEFIPLSQEIVAALAKLRPFVSDNATRPWAATIMLKDGWAYATNNIALAGVPLRELAGVKTNIPLWALDFILTRQEGLIEWFLSDNFIAFKWETGAWLRSQIVAGEFPDQALTLVNRAHSCTVFTHDIDEDFREVFARINDLSDDKLEIYEDRIKGTYRRSEIEEDVDCVAPLHADHSIWTGQFLAPVIQVADAWDPTLWPKACPFKGDDIFGCVIGRTH